MHFLTCISIEPWIEYASSCSALRIMLSSLQSATLPVDPDGVQGFERHSRVHDDATGLVYQHPFLSNTPACASLGSSTSPVQQVWLCCCRCHSDQEGLLQPLLVASGCMLQTLKLEQQGHNVHGQAGWRKAGGGGGGGGGPAWLESLNVPLSVRLTTAAKRMSTRNVMLINS